MSKRKTKNVKRMISKGRKGLLHGGKDSNKTYRNAGTLRAQHDLCLCSDDERRYASDEEAAADKSPFVVCPDCGKTKLRVRMIIPGGLESLKMSDDKSLAVELLLTGLLK